MEGMVTLLALGAIVMPFRWMNSIHQYIGLGELPNMPVIGYLTRSASALYALYGAMFIFLSLDITRYLPLIRFLALLNIAFGIILLIVDFVVGMPLMWTLGEAPSMILFGAVVLWLANKMKPDQQPAA
jgi:hypothetical protein